MTNGTIEEEIISFNFCALKALFPPIFQRSKLYREQFIKVTQISQQLLAYTG